MFEPNQPPLPSGERPDPANRTFLWGMAPFPLSETPANFFVTGGAGSGKTITLRLLLGSVLAHIGFGLDHRAVILDAGGTTESWLGGSDLRCPLYILNPADHRGVAWDIAVDIDSLSTVREMANVFIPADTAAQPFFVDTAREILFAVCLASIQTSPGKWTLRDILNATKSREQLLSLLSRTTRTATTSRFLDDERIAASVISTLATKLAPLEVAAARWDHAPKKISLKHWLRSESMLVVGDYPASHNSVSPLQHAIFNRLADLIIRQEDSTNRRIWILLDNLCQAGPLNRLAPLLQRARSKGACVAFSFRDIAQLRSLYGQQADELAGSCVFKTALRTDSQETAVWAERQFGPPLRASDLESLPRTGPEHGLSAFHHTPKAGTCVAHKSWEWVVAHLPPHAGGTK